MQQEIASIMPAQPQDQAAAHSASVNGGVTLVEGATPPEQQLEMLGKQVKDEGTRLRSPRRVRFDTEADNEKTHCLFPKEIALDRLTAFDSNYRGLVKAHPSKRTPAEWANDKSLKCLEERGEVGAVAASREVDTDDILPPPFGAGYVTAPDGNPLSIPAKPLRVVFKVDSGNEPWTIISRKVVEQAGLKPYRAKTHLRLADCNTV